MAKLNLAQTWKTVTHAGRQALLKLNTHGTGYAALSAAGVSVLTFLNNDNGKNLGIVLNAGHIHVAPATLAVGTLVLSNVVAYLAKPASVKDTVPVTPLPVAIPPVEPAPPILQPSTTQINVHVIHAAAVGKESFMASVVGKAVGEILAEALALAEPQKSAILARLATENVSLVSLLATDVEKELQNANIGAVGALLKPEIEAAIEAQKPKLIALAGNEENLLFSTLEARAKALIASLEA